MKNQKEVDWTKAPDGATHYNAECFSPWLKETPASFFVEHKGVWIEYVQGPHNNHFSRGVKRS